MMPDKFTNRPLTALEVLNNSIEPLSDEERKRLEEEWAKEKLDKIFCIATGNKNIARAICETATYLAHHNNALSDLIKANLKQRAGRPDRWPPHLMRNLLIHYAGAMRVFDNDHEKAREWIIDYIRRTNRTKLSDETIENQISKAIGYIRKGKLCLHNLPVWAQPIIEARLNKGTKTMKRTSMQNRNKP